MKPRLLLELRRFLKIIITPSFSKGLGFMMILASGTSYALDLKTQDNIDLLFIEDVIDKLPKKLKSILNKTVYVEFKDLGPDVFGRVARPHFFESKKNISKIQLNKLFLPSLQKNVKTSSRNKFSRSRALLTLVHEIGHLYDFQFLKDQNYLAQKRYCEQLAAYKKSYQVRGSVGTVQLNSYCNKVLSREKNVSDDPIFLALTGWNTQTESKNTRPNRIVSYALTNAWEYFAVHFSLFLTDSSFKCRMPALNSYFENHFDHRPFRTKCDQTLYELKAYGSSKTISIDPSRVFELHLITASPGDQLASRFGHSMLRVVQCSPKRTVVNKECLKDLQHHVVIAFQGNVEEMSQSALKGLTGYYESRINFYTWTQIEFDYTKNQLRSFETVPLKLNKLQRDLFINRSLELYWTYGGDYKFLSNNCATELLELLASVSYMPSLLQIETITPNGVTKGLNKVGLLDTSRAEQIDSYKQKLDQAYEIVLKISSNLNIQLEYKNSLEFIKYSKVSFREKVYSQVSASLSDKEFRKFIGAMYLLETYIQRDKKNALSKLKAATLLKFEKSPKDFDLQDQGILSELIEDFNKLVELKKQMTRVDDLVVGYGIPQVSDSKKSKIERNKYLENQIQELHQKRDLFFDDYYIQRSLEIDDSKAFMVKMLKKISEIGI